MSPDTVRFYERRHLLPPAARTSAGYRVFPLNSIARMRTIRVGLLVGFSVSELADIFRERDAGGAPCHLVRKLAAQKLTRLETTLRDLQIWRRELRSTLAKWDHQLAQILAENRPGCWKRLLTRRVGHNFWLAAFANGGPHETSSYTGAERHITIGPESETG